MLFIALKLRSLLLAATQRLRYGQQRLAWNSCVASMWCNYMPPDVSCKHQILMLWYALLP
jgi:hypothetical protein